MPSNPPPSNRLDTPPRNMETLGTPCKTILPQTELQCRILGTPAGESSRTPPSDGVAMSYSRNPRRRVLSESSRKRVASELPTDSRVPPQAPPRGNDYLELPARDCHLDPLQQRPIRSLQNRTPSDPFAVEGGPNSSHSTHRNRVRSERPSIHP